MTPLRQVAIHGAGLAVAYAQAKVREEGGNNLGPQVEWFEHAVAIEPGSPYCAGFCFACDLKAYCQIKGYLTSQDAHTNRVEMLRRIPEFVHATGIPRTGYCPTVAAVAKKLGRFHDRHFTPSQGDWVLFDFKGEGEPHHVAIVLHPNPDGTITTCEGNTSSGDVGSQSDGSGVFVRIRNRSHVYGFVSLEG